MQRRFFPWLAPAALLALGACQTATKPTAPVVARFFIEAAPGEEAVAARLPQSGVIIAVRPRPVFTEYDVVAASVVQTDLGPCLDFRLTPDAARDLRRFTAAHEGLRLVLTLNGAAVGARRIDGPWTDGVIREYVEAPDAGLPGLARELRRTSAELQAKLSRP